MLAAELGGILAATELAIRELERAQEKHEATKKQMVLELEEFQTKHDAPRKKAFGEVKRIAVRMTKVVMGGVAVVLCLMLLVQAKAGLGLDSTVLRDWLRDGIQDWAYGL